VAPRPASAASTAATSAAGRASTPVPGGAEKPAGFWTSLAPGWQLLMNVFTDSLVPVGEGASAPAGPLSVAVGGPGSSAPAPPPLPLGLPMSPVAVGPSGGGTGGHGSGATVGPSSGRQSASTPSATPAPAAGAGRGHMRAGPVSTAPAVVITTSGGSGGSGARGAANAGTGLALSDGVALSPALPRSGPLIVSATPVFVKPTVRSVSPVEALLRQPHAAASSQASAAMSRTYGGPARGGAEAVPHVYVTDPVVTLPFSSFGGGPPSPLPLQVRLCVYMWRGRFLAHCTCGLPVR
jgi:hypothetical protein